MVALQSIRKKRVVIVDDSRTIQALLEQILTTRLGYEVVDIVGDGGLAMAAIRRLKPDLVTIDLGMPYISGQQLLRELQAFPDLRKVVISSRACESLAMKASLKRMGADLCICKKEMARDPAEFGRSLSSVMRAKKAAPVRTGAEPAAPLTAVASYPIPADERERLAALAALDLANDNAVPRLDLLTQHLASTTSFPACTITFIDAERQWLKSAEGMGRGSTPRSQAICNYTLCGDEPFIVHDTLEDKRFAAFDAVVAGPMIRSYVGYPITTASGVRLGVICLLDSKPHRVTVKELANLRSIARIAAEFIEAGTTPARQVA